jgi:hypothetical protein
MNNTLQVSLEGLQSAFRGEQVPNRINADLRILTEKVSGVVGRFLTMHSLVGENRRPASGVSLEDLGTSVDATSISTMLEECQIPESQHEAARAQLALVCAKYFTAGAGSDIFRMQQRRAETESIKLSNLSDIFSDRVAGNLTSLEGFGAFVDTTVPDLQNAMTVAIMRFHMGLVPRMLPTLPTAEPCAIYQVPRYSVFDLADADAEPTALVDLFEDPSLVANDLPTVTPLDANDTDDLYLVADSVIRFNVEAPLLDLAIDSETPGYTQTNHTDTIADGAHIAAVKVQVTLAVEGDDDVVSIFRIPIPRAMGRLTRSTDSPDAADRIKTLTKETFINSATLVDGSASGSDIFGDAEDTAEGIKVTTSLNVTLNLKSGKVRGLGTAAVASHHTSGDTDDISEALATAFGASDANLSVALVGYEMDCRHSEENLRKSSIAVREDRGTLAYELPLGRHYIYDSPLSGSNEQNIPAVLARITNLGEDYSALVCITDWLDNVADALSDEDLALSNGDVGRRYAAGSMVRPYVFTDTFDITGLKTRQDADRTGDIAQRVKSYLTSVTARIQAGSFIQEQIAAGNKVVYRLATSSTILACVLGQPHIFAHLNTAVRGGDNGVELRIVLDNDVVIEVVTSNMSAVADKMVLVPYIEADPKSVLNGGAVWDMGTVVGQFTNSNSGAYRRSFSMARQQAVPTNPIGAVIDVTGAYSVLESDLSA